MGQKESPRSLSDKCFWNQIYREMKEMLKSQQFQIETLINDREFLENYVHLQHDQWRCRSRFLESYISQLKEEQANTCLAEDAKMRVFVGCKESEALRYKKQFELAESDLEDCLSCIEAESSEIEELKKKLKSFEAAENGCCTSNVSGSEKFKGRDQSVMSLKKELKKLKHAYCDLSSRKDAEVSSLLAEKDFVWNQFKKMEGHYNGILKSKRAESDQDKKALEKFQNSVEKLYLSIGEKDEVIAKLEADKAMLELDIKKNAGEAKLFVNKMEKIHSDMDEQRLTAIKKDELIANLRKELCILKGDSKKSILKKSNVKSRSEGKSQSCLNTNSQMEKIHSDMDEQRLSAIKKDELIANLRKELCILMGDSKKSILKKSSVKSRSEGKSQSCLNTTSQIQSGSRKRSLESCDTSRNNKRRSPRGVYFETPAPNNDHGIHQHLIQKKARTISPAKMRSMLFHSGFKIPKLK